MTMLWHTDFAPRAAPGEDGGPRALRNRLIAVFHGYFKQHPGKIAVYIDAKLPGIRVFAESMENLSHFVDAVRGHFVVRDYFTIAFPMSLKVEDYGGTWVVMQSYNIRSAASDSLTQTRESRRDLRMAHAKRLRLEYFIIHSQSNQSRFSECVLPVPSTGFAGFKPNSYGLARASDPFALPVL